MFSIPFLFSHLDKNLFHFFYLPWNGLLALVVRARHEQWACLLLLSLYVGVIFTLHADPMPFITTPKTYPETNCTYFGFLEIRGLVSLCVFILSYFMFSVKT